MARTPQRPEYFVLHGMFRRCYDPRHISFKNYGGRGIRVCERWHKFENFFADMGKRPNPKLTLDRRDNDGDYTLKNCHWITRKEQMKNKRNGRWDKLDADKVRAIRADQRRPYRIIADEYGVTRHMIGMIIRRDCWTEV